MQRLRFFGPNRTPLKSSFPQ